MSKTEEKQKADIVKFLQYRQEQGNLDVEESINYVWQTAQNFTIRKNITHWMMIILFATLATYMTYNKISIVGQLNEIQETVIQRCVGNENK